MVDRTELLEGDWMDAASEPMPPQEADDPQTSSNLELWSIFTELQELRHPLILFGHEIIYANVNYMHTHPALDVRADGLGDDKIQSCRNHRTYGHKRTCMEVRCSTGDTDTATIWMGNSSKSAKLEQGLLIQVKTFWKKHARRANVLAVSVGHAVNGAFLAHLEAVFGQYP